ncbi:MAG: hypothetical protein SFV51_24615 [Bryobacteraceae bacterium]|nr:hypothetical protein [Bryobacteraceae bacterium]
MISPDVVSAAVAQRPRGKTQGNLLAGFPYGNLGRSGCKHEAKLAKDVRKCGRANQENKKQNVKPMFKSLFRRMAPLVAGVLLLQPVVVFSDYAYITDIQRSGNTVTVSVQDPPPSGYASPRNASANYYWWIDQINSGYYGSKVFYQAASFTNACVYVYSVDNDLSYAIHDTVNGVSIWNGP